MFGIGKIDKDVEELRRYSEATRTYLDNLRDDATFAIQLKNKEIDALNRKVDTLLDYLGLEYFPERVFVDCIEETKTKNKKGTK